MDQDVSSDRISDPAMRASRVPSRRGNRRSPFFTIQGLRQGSCGLLSAFEHASRCLLSRRPSLPESTYHSLQADPRLAEWPDHFRIGPWPHGFDASVTDNGALWLAFDKIAFSCKGSRASVPRCTIQGSGVRRG